MWREPNRVLGVVHVRFVEGRHPTTALPGSAGRPTARCGRKTGRVVVAAIILDPYRSSRYRGNWSAKTCTLYIFGSATRWLSRVLICSQISWGGARRSACLRDLDTRPRGKMGKSLRPNGRNPFRRNHEFPSLTLSHNRVHHRAGKVFGKTLCNPRSGCVPETAARRDR